MNGTNRLKLKLFSLLTGSVFLLGAFTPISAMAIEDVQELQKKVKELEETVEELDERLNEAELHTATDKISFGVELRTKADSIHYEDMAFAPNSLIQGFFRPFTNVTDPLSGFRGATLLEARQMIGGMLQNNMVPPVEKHDFNNDIIYTNKFRLNMKAKVNNNLGFAGRLAAYKVYGDSSGVKFNQGSLGDVTFDGNTSSLPHSDTIRLERAYFNYKNRMGNIPYNVSFGRRPSTEGPPLEYGNYSLEGGSPHATIINWQFDGASLSFGFEEATNVPGAAFKICYGVGFEGDWGNSFSLNTRPQVDDVHMIGFIASIFDDDTTKLELNYAYASDITDGFTGLTVMPFIVSKQDTDSDGTDEYFFDQNSGGFISRMEPSTNIGDWMATSLLLRTKVKEIDIFLAPSWSHTDPSQLSKNPFFEILGHGLLSSNGQLESHHGYGFFAGIVLPMPLDARFGLEYNWGSKYWFNFTGAEDSLIASKMAARGQVYEGYYIQPIVEDNFFLKLGYQYYDYKYTGSGNPLGAPVEITEITSLDAFFPVVDKVWNAYLSATLRF